MLISIYAVYINPLIDSYLGIAVMSLQNYPVNALDMKTLKSMSEKLAELQRNRCRGLVITSVSVVTNFFSF